MAVHPIPVDPYLVAAYPIAMLLLGLSLARTVQTRTEADQIFAAVLSDNREIAELSEQQRLLIVRMCNTILDRIYSALEERN